MAIKYETTSGLEIGIGTIDLTLDAGGTYTYTVESWTPPIQDDQEIVMTNDLGEAVEYVVVEGGSVASSTMTLSASFGAGMPADGQVFTSGGIDYVLTSPQKLRAKGALSLWQCKTRLAQLPAKSA